jgi:hypothetical protein
MFKFDPGGLLNQTEEFLRRHIKPKHVVAAEKRRTERKLAEAGRRLRNTMGAIGASGAGIFAYVAMAPATTAGLIVAGTAGVLATGAALFWPKKSPMDRISREELLALVLAAEDWLLQQRATLPGRAIPAFDQILFRLNDLHPHLPAIDPHGTLAWDLRRILTEHLPRLVQSYGGLTETVRQQDPELLPRFVEGLETVDEELIRICKEASRDHLLTFEVQEQFLETRYRDKGIGS